MPNKLVLRYDRITEISTIGFLIMFGISALINIILLVICNSVIVLIFYDLKYSIIEEQFTTQQFSVDLLNQIKFVAVEGILRPFQIILSVLVQIERKPLNILLIVTKLVLFIAAFLIVYFTYPLQVIIFPILADITFDLCCILPYFRMVRRVKKMRSKNDIENQAETQDAPDAPIDDIPDLNHASSALYLEPLPAFDEPEKPLVNAPPKPSTIVINSLGTIDEYKTETKTARIIKMDLQQMSFNEPITAFKEEGSSYLDQSLRHESSDAFQQNEHSRGKSRGKK
ncbi:Hypothetical_protein [Hexamita inflata]|uniref:Hypothetical_protein n=1 Tax=Hexamita inflata TaxID=28002 RepID=A0AA86ULR2_9EUKA|nr:Hypothetical protein HINF_LOCUS43907 [Hexamita inflata]